MGLGYFNKEDNGTWSVQFYYTDYAGNKRRKHKLGFRTKSEAKAWMDNFIKKEQSDMDMKFDSFVESYWDEISTDLKASTIDTKKHIIDLHILPYFKDRAVRDITALDIKRWQTEVKKKGFSDTYLRSINAQLSAIFNHAVRFYNLSFNPCRSAGIMGKNKAGNLGVWNYDEFQQFISTIDDDTEFYYAYQLFYWTGMRLGELMALTVGDINFDAKKVVISKTLHRKNKVDIITTAKTDAGMREIFLPDFLLEIMEEYISRLYGKTKKDRLFTFSKGGIEKAFKSSIEQANKVYELPKIRIHDLRHSHATLLISQNVDIATISKRLGHENIKTTLDTYAHFFEQNARGVASLLDSINSGSVNKEDEE